MLIPNNPNSAPIRSSDELARTNADDEKKVPPPPGRKDFKQVLDKENDKPVWNPKEEKMKQSTRPSRSDRIASRSTDSPFIPPTPVASKNKNKENDTSDEDDTAEGDVMIAEAPKEAPKTDLSPLSMYQRVARESATKAPAWMADAQPTETPVLNKKEPTTRKEKASTGLQDEQNDTGHINPFGAPILGAAEVTRNSPEVHVSKVAELQELITQFIDKLQSIEASGKTETVFVVKNIPMFENVKVTITEFKTAQKEFNLTFENLTQEGKNLIDSNINYLQQALEDKGYARAIHIVTTSTHEETPILGSSETAHAKQENDQEREQKREKKRDQDSEP